MKDFFCELDVKIAYSQVCAIESRLRELLKDIEEVKYRLEKTGIIKVYELSTAAGECDRGDSDSVHNS